MLEIIPDVAKFMHARTEKEKTIVIGKNKVELFKSLMKKGGDLDEPIYETVKSSYRTVHMLFGLLKVRGLDVTMSPVLSRASYPDWEQKPNGSQPNPNLLTETVLNIPFSVLLSSPCSPKRRNKTFRGLKWKSC